MSENTQDVATVETVTEACTITMPKMPELPQGRGKAEFDEAAYLADDEATAAGVKQASATVAADSRVKFGSPSVELLPGVTNLVTLKADVDERTKLWSGWARAYATEASKRVAEFARGFGAEGRFVTAKGAGFTVKVDEREALVGSLQQVLYSFAAKGLSVKAAAQVLTKAKAGHKLSSPVETENVVGQFEGSIVVADKSGKMAQVVQLLTKAVKAAEQGDDTRALGLSVHLGRLTGCGVEDFLLLVQGAIWARAAHELRVKLSEYETGTATVKAATAAA
jgi:hypothetical protein